MTQHAIQTPNAEEDAAFKRRMEAVTESIYRYHSYLQDYLYRLTRQWQDAENLAQDLWHYVLYHFEDDQIGSLTLLRRKAYQLFIDHYRRQVRRGEIPTDTIPENTARSVSQEAYTDAEEVALKQKFWAEYPGIDLTDIQKEVLWLHARYGFTYDEIQKQTGVASSTVGDWIAIARKRLTEAVNPQPLIR